MPEKETYDPDGAPGENGGFTTYTIPSSGYIKKIRID